jgi:hypothetical protein
MTIYVFKRDPILDSSGRSIIPNFAVIIEPIDPKTDVVTYSVNKRAKSAFDVTDMFTHEEGVSMPFQITFAPPIRRGQSC